MHVGGAEACQRGVDVATGQGQGELAVGGVFDAVDAPGEDAVVHSGLTGHGAQQRGVGGLALEGQAQDTAFDMGEVIALLGFAGTVALAKFLMRGEVIE